MGDISKNFSRSEFACKCGCGADTVDVELITVLEDLRRRFVFPITINSGTRCEKHNTFNGGGDRSQHLYGKAADFVVQGVHPDEVADILELIYKTKYGIGRYNGRTHVDVRETPARWDNR